MAQQEGTITAGKALMRIDGKLWKIIDFSGSIDTEESEIIMSMSGPAGRAVTPIAPGGSCTVAFGVGDKLADLKNVGNATIEVEIGGGVRTLTWSGATRTGKCDYDGTKGTAPFAWSAMTAAETV